MATVMETTLTVVDLLEDATSVKRRAIRQASALRRRVMKRWPRSLWLMAVDFGDDDLTDIVAEKVTVGSFGDFGETEIPDDFFDHWSNVGSEDDDNSDEEIALVAFDELLGCVPETVVSELEGTSGNVEEVQGKGKECAHCKNDWSHEVGCQGYKEDDDDVSTECPSLMSKE